MKTHFEDATAGLLNINGQFLIQGNMISRQATDLAGTGAIIFKGNNNQRVYVKSAFKNLSIQKPSGYVALDTAATVSIRGIQVPARQI